jgi:hypothetical protein
MVISLLDSDSEASSKVAWHPDGRAFGAPNALNGMSHQCLRQHQLRHANDSRLPNCCKKRLAFPERIQRPQLANHGFVMVAERCTFGDCRSRQEPHTVGDQDPEDLEEVSGHPSVESLQSLTTIQIRRYSRCHPCYAMASDRQRLVIYQQQR